MIAAAHMRVVILHSALSGEPTADDQDTLVQVESVRGALVALGHQVLLLPFGPSPEAALGELQRAQPDLVFNLVETVDGTTPRVHLAARSLEAAGLGHTGAPADAILETSAKPRAKDRLAAAGLPTPPWFLPAADGAHPPFPGPYIIKSCWEHASVGIADDGVVGTAAELRGALERRANLRGAPWFVEGYIEGREFVATLLANPGDHGYPGGDRGEPELLAVAELTFHDYPAGKPRIVNYDAKWMTESFEFRHGGRRFLDSRGGAAEAALAARLADIARATWRAFDLRGYARVDFRVDEAGEPWIIDVNSNPCIAPDSGLVAAAERAGLSYPEVIRRILADACRS